MRSSRIAVAVVMASVAGAIATPVFAQSNSPSQMLQGLLSGNKGQDQAVNEAFERGYQKGRQDQEVADRGRGQPPGRGYQQQPNGYGQPEGSYPPAGGSYVR